MPAPVLKVEIDFASGPSFTYPIILDSVTQGLLDINILGDVPQDVVDISAQVRKVATRRGRNRILANFEAGTATVTLNDPNSDFSPTNTSSPYYGKLLPLRKIRIYAELDLGGSTGIVPISIFSGYITSYDTNFYQGTNADSTVILQCVDGFRLLNNVSTEIPPVPGCTAGQLSGARVNSLLDWADWSGSLRAIQAGNSTMQADPGGNRSILAAIQTIEQSEFGAFFMNRQGQATFFDRTGLAELSDQPPKVYADDGTGYSYNFIDLAYDDQLVLNDVTVVRYAPDGTIPAPVPQIVTNQASIDTYFYKSGQRTGLLIETDAEALNIAQMLVASRADAEQRIDSMLVSLQGETDLNKILDTLSMEIYRNVQITKTMPGGSVVTKELFCQGVHQDITPNSWNVTVFTAEPIIDAFILDSSSNGILDTNALTY
jgi:hypothetical protein